MGTGSAPGDLWPGWGPPAGGSGQPLGLTGAAQPTRYVGGTSAGAPTSGSFVIGDFVIYQSGKVWICTTAGSPGTWVAGTTPPQQLGYVEINSNTATSSSAALIDATGLTTTVTVGTKAVKVSAGLICSSSVAGDVIVVQIQRDGVALRTTTVTVGTANGGYNVFLVANDSGASAGQHTYKVQFERFSGSGACYILGTASQPSSLRVEEVAS